MGEKRRIVMSLVLATGLVAPSHAGSSFASNVQASELENELRAAERAFAETMADRDLDAFSAFLSSEVVFFSGDEALRGPQAVSRAWARFFEFGEAPFSWEPEAVAVLDSGTLGFTSGPVLDPQGTRIGTFNSVWRRLPTGEWRIVFDRGCP